MVFCKTLETPNRETGSNPSVYGKAGAVIKKKTPHGGERGFPYCHRRDFWGGASPNYAYYAIEGSGPKKIGGVRRASASE
jgi:hypothetical protein